MTEPSNQDEAHQTPPLDRVKSVYRTSQSGEAPTIKSVTDTDTSPMEVMLLREFERLRISNQKDPTNYLHARDLGNAMYQYHKLKEWNEKASREILVAALGCFVYAYRLGGKHDKVVVTWLKKIKSDLGLPETFQLDQVPSSIPIPPSVIQPINN